MSSLLLRGEIEDWMLRQSNWDRELFGGLGCGDGAYGGSFGVMNSLQRGEGNGTWRLWLFIDPGDDKLKDANEVEPDILTDLELLGSILW